MRFRLVGPVESAHLVESWSDAKDTGKRLTGLLRRRDALRCVIDGHAAGACAARNPFGAGTAVASNAGGHSGPVPVIARGRNAHWEAGALVCWSVMGDSITSRPAGSMFVSADRR